MTCFVKVKAHSGEPLNEAANAGQAGRQRSTSDGRNLPPGDPSWAGDHKCTLSDAQWAIRARPTQLLGAKEDEGQPTSGRLRRSFSQWSRRSLTLRENEKAAREGDQGERGRAGSWGRWEEVKNDVAAAGSHGTARGSGACEIGRG